MPKKDFKTSKASPALSFISPESIEEVEGKREPLPKVERKTPPAGYKLNPEYIETKSKRVQILIQPSLHEAIKAKAEEEGISTNEAINQAIKEYVER